VYHHTQLDQWDLKNPFLVFAKLPGVLEKKNKVHNFIFLRVRESLPVI
jgi:hypothetical protein